MIVKIDRQREEYIIEVFFIIIINGRSRVSSTSKIINTIAIKKKCRENGRRAKFLGSKPHSNGLDFSRSIISFLVVIFRIIVKIIIIIIIIIVIIKLIFIICTRI